MFLVCSLGESLPHKISLFVLKTTVCEVFVCQARDHHPPNDSLIIKAGIIEGFPTVFCLIMVLWYYLSTLHNICWQICSASFQTQRNGHVPPLSTNTPSSRLPPLRNGNALPPLHEASVPPPSYGEVVAPPVYQNVPPIGNLPPLPQPAAPPGDEL